MLVAIILLFLSVIIFFFWAKSPNLPKQEYATTKVFEDISDATNSSDTIQIVSYNLGYLSGMTNNEPVRPTQEFYDKNLKKAKEVIKSIDADIIGFQEIDYGSKRSYEVDQLDQMAHASGLKYAAQAVNWDKTYVPYPYLPVTVHFGKIISGQSILSKFPILSHERVVLEKVASAPFYYNAIYLDRLLQISKIALNGQEVIFMNIHTEAFDKPTRVKQTQFIYEQFKKYAKEFPVILVGDFNSHPVSESADEAAIQIFLKDNEIGSSCPSELLGKQEMMTYPSDQPKEQLDYIFFTKAHFKQLEWKVLYEFGEVSDHLPISVKLAFKNEEANAQQFDKSSVYKSTK